MKFFSGLMPYTDAERAADRAEREVLRAREATRRKACRTDQNYDQPGTAESRKQDLRIIGESV
jgi:hypothetical protein